MIQIKLRKFDKNYRIGKKYFTWKYDVASYSQY